MDRQDKIVLTILVLHFIVIKTYIKAILVLQDSEINNSFNSYINIFKMLLNSVNQTEKNNTKVIIELKNSENNSIESTVSTQKRSIDQST